MTKLTTHLGRTARRLGTVAVLLTTAGTAVAHGGGSYGGGMMGGGLFGGGMGLWGLLWLGILLLVPLALVYALTQRGGDASDDRPRSVLRERYARGELSDEEFERRRDRLDRLD